MFRKLLIATAVLVACWSGPLSALAEDLQLMKVVALQRHGVRPPSSTREITPLAADPWPTWDVPDGQLTSHGRQAIAELGKWEGQMLRARGLLRARCPQPSDVFAWTNSGYQRTIDTADTLLAVLFPGCGLKAGHLQTTKQDPLFTASESEVGRLDQDQARMAVMARMGGRLDRPDPRLTTLMAELQSVLRCCAASVCQKAAQKDMCTFADRPSAVSPTAEGRSVNWTGPLGEAATIAQVLLLEYANGFPPEQVGWGRASTAEAVIRLSELRKIKYEYQERVPYIARRGASNILNQILLALEAGAGLNPADADKGLLDAHLVLFVGSDTQIAEVGGILDAHWQLKGYLDDETPPGGGLVFELLQEPATGARFVHLVFVAQTLEQIRAASALGASNPPNYVTVTVPGCPGARPDGACPVESFVKLARSKMDMTAVTKPAYH
jgi:4-phytase/acid phosphatase